MNGLDFSVDWVDGATAPPEEAATICQLKIVADAEVLTRVEDLRARSVRHWIRVSAYPLALWFAANWWRLLFEPKKIERSPTDWRLSHEVASAGCGYVWPKLTLVSDGAAVQIIGRESIRTEFETIRFIGNSFAQVSFPSFEKAVGDFIELVLLRLAQFDLPDTDLNRLWSSVSEERRDPHQAFRRRIEARLGYDAETAADDALSAFDRLAAHSGQSAAEEIAAIFNPDMGGGLATFESLASGPGVRATAPLAPVKAPTSAGSSSPWDVGRSYASMARAALGLQQPVLEDAVLAGVFNISDARVFGQSPVTPSAPLGLAVRERQNGSLKLVFRAWRRANRRFEAARYLCESLSAPKEDIWLPLTDAATARQKIQRAFAAEFLMPIEELKHVAGPDFTSEKIENAAETFGVSALAVRSHLANNNLIARF